MVNLRDCEAVVEHRRCDKHMELARNSALSTTGEFESEAKQDMDCRVLEQSKCRGGGSDAGERVLGWVVRLQVYGILRGVV